MSFASSMVPPFRQQWDHRKHPPAAASLRLDLPPDPSGPGRWRCHSGRFTCSRFVKSCGFGCSEGLRSPERVRVVDRVGVGFVPPTQRPLAGRYGGATPALRPSPWPAALCPGFPGLSPRAGPAGRAPGWVARRSLSLVFLSFSPPLFPLSHDVLVGREGDAPATARKPRTETPGPGPQRRKGPPRTRRAAGRRTKRPAQPAQPGRSS
jgi:hypothetical protein